MTITDLDFNVQRQIKLESVILSILVLHSRFALISEYSNFIEVLYLPNFQILEKFSVPGNLNINYLMTTHQPKEMALGTGTTGIRFASYKVTEDKIAFNLK